MQTFEGLPTEPFSQPSGYVGSTEADHKLIGIYAGRQCAALVGSLVSVSGHKLAATYRNVVTEQVDVPDALREIFGKWSSNTASPLAGGSRDYSQLSFFSRKLSVLQADLIRKLSSVAMVPLDDVLAVGLLGPGLWQGSSPETRGYLELCDVSRIAEQCGCNVVSNFAERDLAAGGLGGPQTAIPQWLLLRKTGKTRLLLDVGRSVRLTLLPGGQAEEDLDSLLAFDVGPGTALLDRLSLRLSEGRLPYDPGGTLAVQGTKVQKLIDRWLADPYFRETPPRWQPYGVCAEEALDSTVRMAVDAGWSIRDLLCTATHFIARCIALAVHAYIPGGLDRIDELLVSGGGQSNGMLLAEIRLQLGQVPLTRTIDLGWPQGQLEAATVAVLAGMHLDHVPASRPALSGTDVPRIAGQLTPGSPAGWGRLIRYMHAMAPTHLSLRNAV